MSRYEKFLNDLAEYTSTYYDFGLSGVTPPCPLFMSAFPIAGATELQGPRLDRVSPATPNEIRSSRVRQEREDYLRLCDWHTVVSWFGPAQLCIKTPSWLWHMLAEVLWQMNPYEHELHDPDKILTFDPLAEKRPGMYAYEKRIIWDVFSGLPIGSTTPKVSLGSFTERSIFQRSATTYLHYVMSIGQAVYKAGMAVALGKGEGTAAPVPPATGSEGPQADATAGAGVDGSTSRDHQGTD